MFQHRPEFEFWPLHPLLPGWPWAKLQEAWLMFSGKWGSEKIYFPRSWRGVNEGIHTESWLGARHPGEGCISRKKMGAREFSVTFSMPKLELPHIRSSASWSFGACSRFGFWRKWSCWWYRSTHLWDFRFLRSWPGSALPHPQHFCLWVSHCWSHATKMSLTSSRAAGHHPEKTAQAHSPAPVMGISEDSHLLIQGCALLFIQTGIISWRELCVIAAW